MDKIKSMSGYLYIISKGVCAREPTTIGKQGMGGKENVRPSLKHMLYIYCNGGKKHQVIYKTWKDLQSAITGGNIQQA